MKPPFFSLLLMAALTFGAGLAHAEKADRDQPMNVEADALRHDDLKQTSVFTGRVVLTKGTILIRGDRIEVRQDDAGNQFGVVTPAPGQLAFFRQKREGVDEFIEGEGERIEYDSQADTVKFIGQAQMRRYRGSALGDELTGGMIVYSNTTDVFSIDGAAAKAGAPPGRVRAMMTPQPESASSAPARAPVLPGPALRPSNTLRGEQK